MTDHRDIPEHQNDTAASDEVDDCIAEDSDPRHSPGHGSPGGRHPVDRAASMLSARNVLRSEHDAASETELDALIASAMAADSERASSGRPGTVPNSPEPNSPEPSDISTARRNPTRHPAKHWIAAAAASIVIVLGVATVALNNSSGGGSASYSANDSGTSQTATAESDEGSAKEPSSDQSSTAESGNGSEEPAGVTPSTFAGAHGSGTIPLK